MATMDLMESELQRLFAEGCDLLQTGKAERALGCFQRAQRIAPSNPTLYLYSGAALHDLQRFDEAVESYGKALTVSPCMGEAHNNLGNSLIALGRFAAAVDSFSKAITFLPLSPVPLAARATALQALGKIAEAEADCRAALTIAPDFASAHWNLALNLLLQGRYLEGWSEYEWRWKKPDFTSPSRHTDIPLWNGTPLNGRTILIHAEQGFGDAIQFVRYVLPVVERGGSVIVECHPELEPLVRSIEGIQDVVPFGGLLPHVSCQVPLLSLPRIFATTLQTIPSSGSYLAAPDDYRKKWQQMMPAATAGFRVGIAWAGKSYPDPLRSCRLRDFAPFQKIINTTFYSLQIGCKGEQTDLPDLLLIDMTEEIHDFADTAALIEQLDLVISIDTAVAHLAGALAKPVWLLLPFAPDWRWMREGIDSPWYSTMRLFRQEIPQEWEQVISIITNELILLRQKKPLE
ncbi:MAG: tetratricopeptide repeat-containing glycosyltransferase family protein [Desulfuromonadaceae bacterium]|nr:tetratricopeptide repeat-containing glycosyltransferase family protein [Desulfuromonadaceae bacterium]